MDVRFIEALLPHVNQYAPGCAEPLAIDHIRQAAVVFCNRTRCWRYHDHFMAADHQPEILCTPPYAVLFQIEHVFFDGHQLTPAEYNDHRFDHREGFPQVYRQSSPNTLNIAPHSAGKVNVSMFLQPSPEADVLPGILIDNFGRDIGNGALSTLLMLPGQPFSNPQMSVIFSTQFQTALDRNFSYNVRGQTRGKIRSRSSFK